MAEAKKENGLIAAGAKAYGIDEKYILSSKVYPGGKVVIVTHGGVKVCWKKGDKAEPLEPIRVDGIIRKKMKPVTGAKKKKEKKNADTPNVPVPPPPSGPRGKEE